MPIAATSGMKAMMLGLQITAGKKAMITSPEIMALIMGDFATFAAGVRSVEDTARIIQSRVQIWLSEQELVFG